MSFDIIVYCICGFLSRLDLFVINRKEDIKKIRQKQCFYYRCIYFCKYVGVYDEELKIWINYIRIVYDILLQLN